MQNAANARLRRHSRHQRVSCANYRRRGCHVQAGRIFTKPTAAGNGGPRSRSLLSPLPFCGRGVGGEGRGVTQFAVAWPRTPALSSCPEAATSFYSSCPVLWRALFSDFCFSVLS